MVIAHLKEFIELARQLNYTSAAKTLHLSQPALSNHVRQLEAEAGALLVERSSGGITRLTPAGQRLLDMAIQMAETYDAAMADIRHIQACESGSLRIRVPRQEYAQPLVQYIYEFRTTHPNIDVALSPWEETDGYTDVMSGAVDLAFVGPPQTESAHTDPTPYDGVGCVVYHREKTFAWIDRSDPLAAMTAIPTAAIEGRTFAIPANQKRNSWVPTMRAFAAQANIQINVVERYCDSLEDFLMSKVGPSDLFICSAGVTCMPAICIRGERVVRDFTPPVVLDWAMAYPLRDSNPALRAFVEFLVEKGAQESA